MTSPEVGRRMRARYAGTAGDELSRSVPLEDGEPVLLSGGMRLRALGLPRPVVLRLTPRRLSVVLHYALQPDRVIELPRGAVNTVDLARGAVRITWRGADREHVLRLTSGGGRVALARPLDADAVAGVLQAWLGGPHRRHRHSA